MRISSSTASSSRLPSLRMCEMYLPPVLRRDLAQLDQLVGRRVERRRVDQRRADAERALLHRLPHERAHLVELLPASAARLRGRSRARGSSWRRRTTRRSARRRASRGRRRYSPSVVQVMSYLMSPCCSTRRFFIASLSGPIELPSPKISSVTPCRMSPCERPSAISDSVDQRQHVDEAGRDREAGRVDGHAAGRAGELADCRDLVAPHPDVDAPAGRTRPVVNGAAADDDIERRRLSGGLRSWTRRQDDDDRSSDQDSPDQWHPRIIVGAFLNARGAPPPRALARRLRASLGPQALLIQHPVSFHQRPSTADLLPASGADRAPGSQRRPG